MKRYDKYKLSVLSGLLAISCVCPAGCSELDVPGLDDEEPAAVRVLEATHLNLEENSKKIVIETVLKQDIGDISLDSDSVTVICEEMNGRRQAFPQRVQPVVTAVRCTASDQIASNGIYMDVLVDLTLAASEVEDEKDALLSIREMFPAEHMNILLLTESGVSDPIPASDYVINNYCKPSGGAGNKKLYRAMLGCLNSLVGAGGGQSGDEKRVLVVFSDGKLYSNERPIDPDHFANQEKLMELSSSMESGVTMYYVDFGTTGEGNDAAALVRTVCSNCGGLYQEAFNWSGMEKYMFQQFGVEYSDYTIELTNPDEKVYDGDGHIISLKFFKDGECVADLEAEYCYGSFYKPIIVNGKNMMQILWHGIVTSIGLLIFIYLLFQFVVPKIRKIIFDRKYITAYKPNMSVSGVIVDSSCYYCKAPFEPGDRVVAKCSHTMHEQCWIENGYHCPEYGRNCRHGSHYYNPDNLLDPGNASFYLPWLLSATVAGALSWIVFSSVKRSFFADVIKSIILTLYKIPQGTPEAADFVRNNIDSIGQFPSFGLFMGMLLTMAMSILTVHRRHWLRMSAEVFVRSFVAGICGYAFFLLACILLIMVDNGGLTLMVVWMPWAFTSIAIALCSSIWTRTTPHRQWIIYVVVISFISMLVWSYIQATLGVDYRGKLLWSFIVFSIGIAFSIASASPVSERYFLRVGGAVKDMDIAIYKWFEANSNRVVTIGRSVDCDLMMAWDVNGDIAPVQANLTKKGHSIYITPLEPGVVHKGKMLPVGKPFRLSHGTSLIIGKTELVYQEKDI